MRTYINQFTTHKIKRFVPTRKIFSSLWKLFIIILPKFIKQPFIQCIREFNYPKVLVPSYDMKRVVAKIPFHDVIVWKLCSKSTSFCVDFELSTIFSLYLIWFDSNEINGTSYYHICTLTLTLFNYSHYILCSWFARKTFIPFKA